ncbi:putative transmembrane anti-sigma factor [Thioalkalivibrio nitratireducens DSM 14787]|uniref:Transmembrane anti-sigma factor n=1 Tax=Thioalkalivibrio nitratireducens (strain DSM 14787 / UNIQEM 213 / ALEN2) TaxID=1255043 RepID=L0DSA4_THIND|nr:zf-HC2 domain-containing protein [Thioalkalivibrio nitratireducens]AGA31860.1 putative transmembrane anti-sigma factor [Thioalkalivibrio nitratireducens DSM 14787]
MTAHEINCEEVIRLLFEYLDRELDPARSSDIDRHLERCRECFSRAEFEKKLRARVHAAAEDEAPPRLRRRVRRLIERF